MISLLTLILQIGIVLVVARLVGSLFRRINQPQVMGEMLAGILLGPSLLGWVLPDVAAALFPRASLGYLNTLSQVGLLLFMFLVGLELDPRLLRGRGQTALLTSHVSIIFPFLLGATLALYLYPKLSDDSVTFTQFALFMGAAMSVTAFPVLARILAERNLMRTKLGAVTIACAAVADVTAWCMLAVVVGLVHASGGDEIWFTVAGSLLYVAFMLWVARPLMRRLEAYYHTRGRLSQDVFAAVLLCLLASAWTTEWIGIHALFGAFLVGALMPKDPGFVHELTVKLEDVTVVFLLPLFFAYTGLRTQVGLLTDGQLWLDCLLVIIVAVVGKFGGSTVAARLTGLSWREAGALGILMNTRGLMELVILTIGLDLGVISPAVFTMMVLMALVTTFMTAPLLEWVYPLRHIRAEAIGAADAEEAYTVLVPVALPSSGPQLLRAAVALAPAGSPRIYALHLHRASEQPLLAQETEVREGAALAPLLDAAAALGVDARPLSFVSRDPGRDIAEVAQTKGARLILMGWHKPILRRSILTGTVRQVMQAARADVVVYVPRGTQEWRRVLVPFQGGVHDLGALELARRLAARDSTEVTILHVVEPGQLDQDREPRLPRTQVDAQNVRLKIVVSHEPLEIAVHESQRGYDVVIIGVSDVWGLEPNVIGRRHERLAAVCPGSLLFVHKHVAG